MTLVELQSSRCFMVVFFVSVRKVKCCSPVAPVLCWHVKQLCCEWHLYEPVNPGGFSVCCNSVWVCLERLLCMCYSFVGSQGFVSVWWIVVAKLGGS